MFYGPLGNSSLSKVTIPNYPKHVFQALIDFLYSDKQPGFGTDEEKNNGSDFMLLLQCAMQYGVLTLVSMCRVEIFKFLGSSSTVRLLEEARILGEDGIEQEALDRIDCNPLHILKEADLSGVHGELMEELLQRSELNVKDDEEIELYNVAKKWALCVAPAGIEFEPSLENKPSLVSVIDLLLKCIRFPLMTAQQLEDGPVKDGIFTKMEAEHIRKQESTTARRQSKKEQEVGELEIGMYVGGDGWRTAHTLHVVPDKKNCPKTSRRFLDLCRIGYPFRVRFRSFDLAQCFGSVELSSNDKRLPPLFTSLPSSENKLMHDLAGTVSIHLVSLRHRKNNDEKTNEEEDEENLLDNCSLQICRGSNKNSLGRAEGIVFGRLMNAENDVADLRSIVAQKKWFWRECAWWKMEVLSRVVNRSPY